MTPFICVPWLVNMCAMTHQYVCHDSFIYVPWPIHVCAMTRSCKVEFAHQQRCNDLWLTHVWNTTPFICVTWPSHMCAMTQSYVCRDSFIFVPRPIHVYTMTRSCEVEFARQQRCHTSWLTHVWDMTPLICVTWLSHTCAMTHSYVCHDSVICVPWLTHMCAMTHSYVWHDSNVSLT